MEAREINSLLLDNFPQLMDSFCECTRRQEGMDTGSISVYEDVFVPYIIEMLSYREELVLKKIFAFVEELASIDDVYVYNVVSVAILDNLRQFAKKLNFEDYLGEKTLEIFNS